MSKSLKYGFLQDVQDILKPLALCLEIELKVHHFRPTLLVYSFQMLRYRGNFV